MEALSQGLLTSMDWFTEITPFTCFSVMKLLFILVLDAGTISGMDGHSSVRVYYNWKREFSRGIFGRGSEGIEGGYAPDRQLTAQTGPRSPSQSARTGTSSTRSQRKKIKVKANAHILPLPGEDAKAPKNPISPALAKLTASTLQVIEVTLLVVTELSLLLLLLFLLLVRVLNRGLLVVMTDTSYSAVDGDVGHPPLAGMVPESDHLPTPPANILGTLLDETKVVRLVGAMPSALSPGMPYFEGSNISEFLERYEGQCQDYHITGPGIVNRLPQHCTVTIAEYIRTMPEWVSKD
jgi:hypothetical protein